MGIKQFYKFQEESISEIAFGENIIIEAPTASGKTEAFLIPVIQKIKKEGIEEMFLQFLYILQKPLHEINIPK